MNIYFIEGWTGFRIDGFGLKKRTDFCGKSSGFEDFETQWILNQLWILERIPDCACLDVPFLGPKRKKLGHRSFFSLGRYVNEFIQFFSNEAHLNSGVRLFGIVLCYSNQACWLLYYLCEINSGIYIYQLTFKLLQFWFRIWLCFRIWTKLFGENKARNGEFAYPYSPPSLMICSVTWWNYTYSTKLNCLLAL